jgi:hypothetical protein
MQSNGKWPKHLQNLNQVNIVYLTTYICSIYEVGLEQKNHSNLLFKEAMQRNGKWLKHLQNLNQVNIVYLTTYVLLWRG